MSEITPLLMGITVWALPLLFAVTLHEAAHGYAALLLGDDTARQEGRLSLNPLRHIDPLGTVLLPLALLALGGFLFGWAKPVPVNFARLRNPRYGMVLVAAAGPLTNVALALLAVLMVRVVPLVPGSAQAWLFVNLDNMIAINLLLAVFNMIPIPPLDGGRVAVGLLPLVLARPLARLERVGMLLIVFALFILPMIGRSLGVDLGLFRWLLDGPVDGLAQLIVWIAGP